MSATAVPRKKYRSIASTTKPVGVRVQIKFKGEVIADTKDATRPRNPFGHVVAPVVYYIPRKDVKMDASCAQHETPVRSRQASYYSLKDGPENAVWSYERLTTR